MPALEYFIYFFVLRFMLNCVAFVKNTWGSIFVQYILPLYFIIIKLLLIS